jgi:hypothetical protein
LLLIVAGLRAPQEVAATTGGIDSNDRTTSEAFSYEQPGSAERQDPPSKDKALNADRKHTDESADRDPELKAYLDYLRSSDCHLTERERNLDSRAVRGASRDELHSLGYSYPEIEASFKRFLAFLDR